MARAQYLRQCLPQGQLALQLSKDANELKEQLYWRHATLTNLLTALWQPGGGSASLTPSSLQCLDGLRNHQTTVLTQLSALPESIGPTSLQGFATCVHETISQGPSLMPHLLPYAQAGPPPDAAAADAMDRLLSTVLHHHVIGRVLTSSFLNHYRLQSGTWLLSPEQTGIQRVSMNELFTRSGHIVEATFRENGIPFPSLLPLEDDAHVVAPPETLAYVLEEVIKNAALATYLKHAEGGNKNGEPLPPIQGTLEQFNGMCRLQLSDDGVGVPPAYPKPMWQFGGTQWASDRGREGIAISNNPRVPVWTGYGIGLPISRVYCRLFGGDLEVRRRPQGGCLTALVYPSCGVEDMPQA